MARSKTSERKRGRASTEGKTFTKSSQNNNNTQSSALKPRQRNKKSVRFAKSPDDNYVAGKVEMRQNATKPPSRPSSQPRAWGNMSKPTHSGKSGLEISERGGRRRTIRDMEAMYQADWANILPRNVFSVIQKLSKNKKDRVQQELKDAINAIHERIGRTLQSAGVEYQYEPSDVQSSGVSRQQLVTSPTFIEKAKETLLQRREVSRTLEQFLENAQDRFSLLFDVDEWLREDWGIGKLLIGDPDLYGYLQVEDSIYLSTVQMLETFEARLKVLLFIGVKLVDEWGMQAKPNLGVNKSKNKKLPDKVIVYEDNALLTHRDKWEFAANTILSVFEEAIRWTKAAPYKLAIRNGMRQFKHFNSAVNTRLKEAGQNKSALEDVGRRLDVAKLMRDKLNAECIEYRQTITKFGFELSEAKATIAGKAEQSDAKQAKVKEMSDRLKEVDLQAKRKDQEIKLSEGRIVSLQQETSKLQVKVDDLEQNLESKNSIQTPRQTSTTPRSRTASRAGETEAAAAVMRLKAEVIEMKSSNTKQKKQIETLETALKAECEKVKALEMAGRALQTLTVASKISVAGDAEIATDGYYKTMIHGMKKEFKAEVERLKAHLKREKQRNDAGGRKLEIQHLGQMQSIYRESVRIFRSIDHFKGKLVSLLDNQNLKALATESELIKNLASTHLAPDVRHILSSMGGDVIEYLHKLETIVAQAFLILHVQGKNPEIKENQKVVSDMQQTMNVMDRNKKQAKEMASKLKEMRGKLDTTRPGDESDSPSSNVTEFQEKMMRTKDGKYLALMSRYQLVWKMYSKLTKEMDILQFDFEGMITQKQQETDDLMVKQIHTELEESAKPEEEAVKNRSFNLKLGCTDRRKNYMLLKHHFEKDKLSSRQYNLVKDLLVQAADVPLKRLRTLAMQYIYLKRGEKMRERIVDMLHDEESDIEESSRDKLHDVLVKLDDRLRHKMCELHYVFQSCETEEKGVYQKLWVMFNEIFLQTGIQFIHPVLRELPNHITSRRLMDLQRRQRRQMLTSGAIVEEKIISMNLPITLVGNRAAICGKMPPKMWNSDDANKRAAGQIDTPRIMQMDINRRHLAAQKVLKRVQANLCPVAVSQSYAIIGPDVVYLSSGSSPRALAKNSFLETF